MSSPWGLGWVRVFRTESVSSGGPNPLTLYVICRCSRLYWSTVDARRRCWYRCRILEYRPWGPREEPVYLEAAEENQTIVHSPAPSSGGVQSSNSLKSLCLLHSGYPLSPPPFPLKTPRVLTIFPLVISRLCITCQELCPSFHSSERGKHHATCLLWDDNF